MPKSALSAYFSPIGFPLRATELNLLKFLIAVSGLSLRHLGSLHYGDKKKPRLIVPAFSLPSSIVF
jgi:hypothetical protein